ncbi:5-dehydro-4-deoxyglucarate dehydratase [Salinicoccus sp. ID82-1]|uniref:5-dehydro-4-deoxyglucarate dehydratase n=2 Tax=Staphylococcaceae TaxID=90964 RepID=A0A558ASZ4_9STAP|nr:5-dehydro-4-deoxyglucarate dehydratase [Salinicoccus sp. ID82-1]MCG1009740.1 5-dehydro-4-deoxyglucarate dehydratase [Salinicoccus sp. ID82-1]TVT27389.1 5-dehydro-4-deoxyglucarate dehydratase [Salinicoccus cyprini]
MNRTSPKGILGFPVTPMKRDGEIDTEAFVKNVEFLLENGLDAIFPVCGAGEYTNLDDQEYEQLIELTMETVDGKVPVYTGVGGNIQEAKRRARISEAQGVEGYLIMPPYLVQGSQDGLYEYFAQIAKSTNLNAIVYQRNNAILEADTLERLTEIEQIVGFKDGNGNMERNNEFTHRFAGRIDFLNGMPMAEVTMAAYMPLGYDSYSSAISNYIPHISRQYFDALKSGDQEAAKEIYEDVILPLNRIRGKGKGYAVSLIKAGMEIVGLPVDKAVRPPVTPVDPAHFKEMEAVLKAALEKYPSKTYEKFKA